MSPRQFDIYQNPNSAAAKARPYLLVLQHGFLDAMKTRLVAPLATSQHFQQMSRLNPAFEIESQTVFLSPTEIAVFPLHQLKTPIANVAAARDAILAAIDLVFTGI